MAEYSGRQSTYVDGDTITAADSNDEFDQLVLAFGSTGGHKHDGTAGGGANVPILQDDDNDTKIQVEKTADDDTIRFDALGNTDILKLNTSSAVFNDDGDNFSVRIEGGSTETVSANLLYTDGSTGAARVGIGTSSPSALFHVNGVAETGSLQFSSTSSTVVATQILDEDAMGSDSAVALATQQSIKAYVDGSASTGISTIADVSSTGAIDGSFIVFDSTDSTWKDQTISGDVTITKAGVASLSTDSVLASELGVTAGTATASRAVVLDSTNSVSGINDIGVTSITSTGDLQINGSTVTAAGLALMDDASASAQRTTMGVAIGSDVQAWDQDLDDISSLQSTDSGFIVGTSTGWAVESGATARTSLGVSIGADVQAWDQDLEDISSLQSTDSGFIVGTSTGWAVESGTTARTSMGVGAISTLATIGSTSIDDNAITLRTMAHSSTGGPGVITYDTTGAPVELLAGTAGEVLTVGSSGGPTWAASGGGAQVSLITHTSDTALATQAAGGSQMGVAVSMTVPTAGSIRITILDMEYDETEGTAIAATALGLKVGADAILWGAVDNRGGTSGFNVFEADASASSILYKYGNAPSSVAGGSSQQFTFDIVGTGMSTGAQGVGIWLGDNVNSRTGEITITGTTTTARFLVEVIDGS